MKKNKIIISIALIFFMGVSCKKFLEVKPKGIIIAETISDFEALLNSDRNLMNPFGLSNGIIKVTDDLTEPGFSTQNNTSAEVNLYFWREYINNTPDKRPDVWSEFYNVIANMNEITEGVMDASNGTTEKKKEIYAEALVNKSFIYFQLLSFFSPAYDQASASTDYGVPYITSTDISQPEPTRPTLQQSYDFMINDLLQAIPDLPEESINNARANKNAAFALLARIYMTMKDYTNAEKYADSVLNSSAATILDYNDYAGADLPATNSSPEELFVRYSNNIQFTYSDNLLSKYDIDKDLRIKFFAILQDDNSYLYGGSSYNPNRGITYAEIYLDKAECLARRNKINDALDIVNNDIRENRFTPADYTPLTATTKEEAIDAVLEERRRELGFKGVRWSDMKRLDADNRMSPVNRYANDGTTVLETLEPHSSRYTFQIPLAVQSFNPSMPLN